MLALRKGQGRPLVLLHGAGVDHRILTSLEEVFRRDPALEPRWERLYLDLPGSGCTPAPSAVDGSSAVVDEVLAWIDEELGDRPFALVGNSWGGLLARSVTAQRSEQVLGLCLLAPVAVADHAARTLPPRTVLATDQALLDGLDPRDREDYEEMAVVQSAADWKRFRDHVLPGLRASDDAVTARIAQRYELRQSPEGGTSYAGPTLIVTGRQDHVVGYADTYALLPHYPRATFVTLDATGHNVHLEQPAVVGALFADWLDRLAVT